MKKLLLIVLSITAFHIYAEEQKTAVSSEKTVEFYAGISLGWDHMIAKRTEQFTNVLDRTLYFSDSKTQTTNAVSGKLIVGFLWNIPNTAFALSPEIYMGQGNAQITLQKSVYDPDAGVEKSFQSTLKQNVTMGIILRSGFYITKCKNNFLYILVGIDQTKFENKFTFNPNGGAGVPPLFEKRSKFLRSSVFGFGFERKINRFKIGIDIRYFNYPEWGQYSKKSPIADDIISIKFKPRIISTALNICYLF